MAEPGTRLTPKPANRQGPRLPATARSAGAFLSERQENLSECHCPARWAGWQPEQQFRRLGMVANNTRFLILSEPGGFPNLASRFLAGMTRRLSGD